MSKTIRQIVIELATLYKEEEDLERALETARADERRAQRTYDFVRTKIDGIELRLESNS